MHKIKLTYVLRAVSILIIFMLVFLIIKLIDLKNDVVTENIETYLGEEYEYELRLPDNRIPGFTYDLESLFPRKLIPEIVETEIVSKPIKNVEIPTLQFIGMIETSEKVIYSFRNMDTNRLLLLEEGASVDGLTLLLIERPVEETVEGTVYTFKKDGITFQVDKK